MVLKGFMYAHRIVLTIELVNEDYKELICDSKNNWWEVFLLVCVSRLLLFEYNKVG